MAEPLKKDLREAKLPNPFSVKFTHDRPRYKPGSTIDTIPLGSDCLIFRYLPRDSFASPLQCQEYARDILVQLMRDWMQPRLNHWAHQMADLATKLPMGMVEYTEIAMNTLWNVHLVLDELLRLFVSKEEQESMEGRAFRLECRARLLPYVTIKPLYKIITQTLEVAYAIMKEMIDTTERRERRSPSFSTYREEDESIYRTRAPPMEEMEGLSLSMGVDEEERQSRRRGEERMLLKRIRRLYEDLNRGSSLLWGLSHVPAFAVSKKRALNIVEESVMNVTDCDIYSEMQKNLRDLKMFLAWFATNWPWTKSDVVTEVNARYDLELDEEARSPDRKHIDVLVDIDELVEKMTIDRLAGKIYQITIEDYPRTRKTVELLRFCLDRQNHYGRDRLVSTLIHCVTARLLHVGIQTFTILHAYASAVESLRVLDSSCVIMHRVCKVIKEYIKKRPDTVRQIITYITTEKRHDINFAKHKNSAMVVDEDDILGFNDEFLPGGGSVLDGDDDPRWEKWMPDPPDAQPGESCRFRKSADVFNMLVSVYGSKEMFVKEYRQLLAERLGNHQTRDPEWERKYLNLLHLRFSDGELQQCEVMLRDVEQSITVNQRTRGCAPLIRGHIISSHFWPNVDQERGVEKLPACIEDELEAYDLEFRKIRKNRRLEWMRASGMTEISLTIDDVKIEKTVPNVMAVVLYAYLEKEEWDINEMAEHLKTTKQMAKRRMEWWEAQGVLTQYVPTGATTEVFRLTKNPSNMHRFKSNMDGDEDDSDDEEMEDPMDAVESLEQYWKYTKSFIANQENSEVKPERMLSIYRMFQSPSSQQISLDTVIAFLSRKVKLGLLTMNNGLYKVVKETDGKIKG
ncbi:hypothetical protein PENTCL1PPCAC_13056 [Pristionchus entomophagus]|uniref:Anaphase-promoting complex subunit 2 n=1 Tax=Pristionchus entomophagus TaxID=358040 RepID=A0AAV5T5M8_9BILA|nr:hypothetical protein PENTCL1PPCAC_13056 [Pristionchus entomophagus]